MANYKTGRIYRIIHNESNIQYVGSTFNRLSDRWRAHKKDYKYTSSGISIYEYFNKFGIENFTIMLIKEYQCADRKQLLAYEQLWINKINCINKKSAFQILYKEQKKQYRNINKDKIIEHGKQYRAQNVDKIKEYLEQRQEIRNEKFNCECGGKYTLQQISTHSKTNKHKKYFGIN